MSTEPSQTGLEIAIIGMAGRFPGARDIDQFWENLKNGAEFITFFTDEEIIEAGNDPLLLENPDFVRSSGGVLEDREYFDASFFGYSALEAEIMDPQVRIFHECAWHSLENAGCDPFSFQGLIGLYAGASFNFYWEALVWLSGKMEIMGDFATTLLVDRDYLCTRVSYNLDLKGPSVIVKTACSTSLVAVHMACQGILNGECDMALAGGVTITRLSAGGYLYQEGMILSPDGHCRAFDAKAQGIVGGDGVGVVVLKRLEDAVRDGDYIHAVIKGTAINNDGIRKAGYTAPSVMGQAEVVSEALQVAEVAPETITFVETHGTGTTVGDPIEIEALKMAFNTDKKGFCKIGSVKTNVGHLDSAAGIASLIKTILALKHKLIPPSLHFEMPNPKIDLENSPFCVNNKLVEWESDGSPLRAGVSSFAIGGTNAHAVLEEAPGQETNPGRRNWKLLLLSAKTQTALERAAANLAEFLKHNPDTNLADAAYTLQVGRSAFPHRRMVVGSDADSAAAALSAAEPGKHPTFHLKEENTSAVFMFPGLGAQYVKMGWGLYETEPVFREEMDRCFKILQPLLDCDIKEILYPASQEYRSNRSNRSYIDINRFEIAQVVVFILEYALAKLLMNWGVKPHAMIGYSFGEYTAACLADVFSLEDALKLVVFRGQLIDRGPGGAMLSVPMTAEELTALIPGDLSLAIDNGPSCIVSGPCTAVDAFEKQLKGEKYLSMKVPNSHALHSKMMESILREFEAYVDGIKLSKPQIPYISNVTGTWITVQEAVDPVYWARHLRETVQFARGIDELRKEPNVIFIEIGPGRDLTTLLVRHREDSSTPEAFNLVRQEQQDVPDDRYLLSKIGHLWLHGIKIQWKQFYEGEKRCRIPLPTYAFDGQRYWIEGNPFSMAADALYRAPSPLPPGEEEKELFCFPSWKPAVLPVEPPEDSVPPPGACMLMFINESNLALQLVKQLEEQGTVVFRVKTGTGFKKIDDFTYTINPRTDEDYRSLLTDIKAKDQFPASIVHLWGMDQGTDNDWCDRDLEFEEVDRAQELGLYSLLHLAGVVGKPDPEQQVDEHRCQIKVVTNNMQKLPGDEGLCPGKSTVLAAVKMIPRQYPNISCCSIDISLPGEGTPREERLIEQLLAELKQDIYQPVIAYRGYERLEQYVEPVRLFNTNGGKIPNRLKEKGVYLFTGGLEGIGFEIAQYLLRLPLDSRLAFIENNGSSPAGDEGEDRGKRLTESRIPVNLSEEIDFLNAAGEKFHKELGIKGMETYRGLEEMIDELCSVYILDYLRQNSIQIEPGKTYDSEDLRKTLKILPKYYKLYDFFIRVLSEEKIIEAKDNNVKFLKSAAAFKAPTILKEEVEKKYPQFRGSLRILEHCSKHYTPALSGEIEALSVLFPGGKFIQFYDDYQDPETFSYEQVYILLFQELLAKVLDRSKGEKKLRILEIGAGNGILTQVIAPGLKGKNVEYHFTDIGNFFVVSGRKQFTGQEFSFMKFGVFDITMGPEEQGCEKYSFDMIVGLNVVHATPSIEASLVNLKSLLAPNGILCIIEGTNPRRWLNMIDGLAEGWWYFEDTHIRPHLPLLSLDTWEDVFDKAGFRNVSSFPRDKAKRITTDRGLIIGQQDREVHIELDTRRKEKIARNFKVLGKAGGDLQLVHADMTNLEKMQEAVSQLQKGWGPVSGLFHCVNPRGTENETGEHAPAMVAATLSSTIKTLLVLDTLFKDNPLDLFVFCVSTHSVTTGNGSMGRCAADIFMNSFAQYKLYKDNRFNVTLNWDPGVEIDVGRVFETLFDPLFAFNRLDVSSAEPVCRISPTSPDKIPGKKYRRPELSHDYAPPGGEIEQVMVDIWQEFLGIDRVGIYDDFLELGADSLVFVTIASRIHKALDVNVPIPEFFSRLNIKGVAEYIIEAKKEKHAAIELVEKKEYYAMSSVQQRLYFLQQMNEQAMGYNIPFVLIWEGEMDRGRFEDTFKRLIKRQESLRTSFEMIEGEPIQKIHENVEFKIEYYDLTNGRSHLETKNCIKSCIRPFDLSRAPLFRVGLIKETESRQFLVVDMHHIVSDGVSIGLIVKEFTAFYGGEDLQELRVTYKDFSEWQNSSEVKEYMAQQETYWLKQFADEIPVLNLPGDSSRPAIQRFEGAIIHFEIEKMHTTALKTFALDEGATLFMLLLTLYNILLSKLSDQEDIVVGTPVAGRRHSDLENIIGMFVNMLALRNFPNGEKTFKQFLNETKNRTLKAFENQDYQYEDLVEGVNVDRDVSRNPLFDVMFMLQNIDIPEVEFAGMSLKPYPYDQGTSRFDLSFWCLEVDETLAFTVEYSTNLFKPAAIERFIDYFKKIISTVVQNPQIKISDIQIISEDERKQLLFDFNAAGSDYPGEKSIRQLFEKQVNKTPGHIAAAFEENHLSYKMLNQRSNQLASRLREKGAALNKITGIMLNRSLEMLIGIMAILKTGGAYLPIDPGYPQERKSYILKDSNVKRLLFMKQCESSLGESSQLIDLEDKALYRGVGENPGIVTKSSDPVYVIYTSGSTGKPKGVMVEHRNIVNYICWAIKIHKKEGNLNFPLFTSFSFDLTVTSIFVPLLSGNTVVVYEESEQVYVIGKIFDDHRLDVVKLTPSHLKLIQAPRSMTIKHLILGGENLESQLALKTLEKFSSDVVIFNEYGPTETAVGCMIYQFSPGTDTRQFVPIGIPAGNVQIYVLDKNKRPLPPGVPGEIYISGDGVSRGYLNQPHLTAERFIDNPFLAGKRMYKTGDLATFLPGNQIEFLGRIDHQVKIRGFRIELEEIQDKLMGYKKNKPIAFFDKDVNEIDLNKHHLCQRCLLPDNYPGIHLDDEGVCNICREFERYEDEVNNYFKTGEDFEQLIARTQKSRQGEYDCLLLFSGGKDSTYVLYQLIDMGLRVLTFTFDNGYISEAAFANIRRTTSDLNVENIVCTAENMNKVFVESLNTHHDVCHGCWNALNAYGIKVAHEHGINLVISGLSRGQIFEMRLEGLFREGIFDEEQVEQHLLLFRRSFHSRDNKFSRLLNVDLPEDAVDNIHFVDFFRYYSAPVAEIRQYLKEKGWIQPEDTGFCSSNCLINDVGIYVHFEKEGYHFYAPQLSWDCRLGCIPREQGLKEIAFAGDGKYQLTSRILEEIGYYNPPIKDAVVVDREGDSGDKKLIAYIVSHEQLVVPELRDYLARKLPDYMIPSHFVQVEKIPLTPNGKVDKKSLENQGTQVGTGVEFEAPESDIEEKMVEIWKQVLHVDTLGIRDNFFDLGGNSMDIMRVNSRLIKLFEKDIPVAMHFRYTTIKSFVQYLGQEGVADSHISDRAEELKRGEQSKMSRLKARKGVLR